MSIVIFMLQAVIQSLIKSDLSDIYHLIYLTADEMRQFPMEIKDFIQECTYLGTNCDMRGDFIQNYNKKYGYCYTFNGGFSEKPAKIQ